MEIVLKSNYFQNIWIFYVFILEKMSNFVPRTIEVYYRQEIVKRNIVPFEFVAM